MFCPNCGTPNPDTAQTCARCAHPLLSSPSVPTPSSHMRAGATFPAAAPAPAVSAPPQPKTMHGLGMLGIFVTVLLAILYAAAAPLPELPNDTQAAGYRFGTFFAVVGLAWLVSYVAAGRKKARDPNLFAILFCDIGIGMLALNIVGNLKTGRFHVLETTDQKVNRLMREAAGLQPVHKPFFGESRVDALLRDLFKEMITLNREYQDASDKVDLSAIGQLYTARSFVNPATATEGLKQLHAAYDLDTLQDRRLQEIIEKFRRKFGDLSPFDRESQINAFNKGLAEGMPLRQRAISAEKAWIDSVDDVYNYARSNHAWFKLSESEVVISNHVVLLEFNSRVDTMNRCRKEFLQAKKDLDDFQQRSLKKRGITPEQTGLH